MQRGQVSSASDLSSPQPITWLVLQLKITTFHLSQSNMDIIYRNVWFYGGVLGDGGCNGAISGSNKSNMAAAAILEKFQMAISPQPVVRSTPCLVLGGFFGDGESNGAISANHMYGQFTCLRRQHHVT